MMRTPSASPSAVGRARSADREAVVSAANRVLAACRGEPSHLERRRGRLWLVTKWGEAEYQLRRSDQAWPTFRYGTLGLSGTSAVATAMLVRWCRGLTRRPLVCWDAWLRHGLGGPEVLEMLAGAGYADPGFVSCVLCGVSDPTDWWCLDGVVGPCCSFGVCRTERSGA